MDEILKIAKNGQWSLEKAVLPKPKGSQVKSYKEPKVSAQLANLHPDDFEIKYAGATDPNPKYPNMPISHHYHVFHDGEHVGSINGMHNDEDYGLWDPDAIELHPNYRSENAINAMTQAAHEYHRGLTLQDKPKGFHPQLPGVSGPEAHQSLLDNVRNTTWPKKKTTSINN